MKQLFLAALVAGGFALAQTPAHATTYTYVGSWEVNSGPFWENEPQAYTGQQAAALLFGGTAGEYVISTNGSNPTSINFDAWYSVLGYGGPNDGGVQFAQNYVSSGSDQCCGLYYAGGGYAYGDVNEAASAFVADNAGYGNVNYAFLVAAPEPASLAIVGAGLAGLAAIRRRKRA